jgi:uncharacterized protein
MPYLHLRVKRWYLAPFAAVLLSWSCAHGIGADAFGGNGGTSSSEVASSGNGSSATTVTGPTTSIGSNGATTSSTAAATTSSSGSSMAAPGTLLFSEYVEGSGNNKALEIINRGPTTVSLQGCEIDPYQNGSTTAGTPTMLNPVSLPAGGVFVVCNTAFAQSALCDELSGAIVQTGNDAIELSCNGVLADSIGRVGEDLVWGTAPTTTMDATLRRKCSVLAGDTDPSDPFDPALEWDGYAIDAFSDLGQYACP